MASYDETERPLTMNTLGNLGLNPAAVKMLVEDYKAMISPFPIKIVVSVGDSPIMRLKESEKTIEIYVRKPGYVGRSGGGDASKIRKFARRMVAKSYSDYVSPRLMSFVFDGIEVAIKTKGVDEGKNIARNIYNPTQ